MKIDSDGAFSESTVMAWAQMQLPGRIDAARMARVLGFAEHDIPVLIRAGMLKPLGKPAPNGIKWFSSLRAVCLAADLGWLDTATKRISQHHVCRNQGRRGRKWGDIESQMSFASPPRDSSA